MPNTTSTVGRRAWSLVRLTLLWARKGGIFKRRLLMVEHLRVVPKFLKSIGHYNNNNNNNNRRRDEIGYYMGERELSFDKTPMVHYKRHHRCNSMQFIKAHMPCINPEVEFDYDFDYEEDGVVEDGRAESDEESIDGDEEGEGIDVRAEEFIAKFYEQLRLQRQISYLECNQ